MKWWQLTCAECWYLVNDSVRHKSSCFFTRHSAVWALGYNDIYYSLFNHRQCRQVGCTLAFVAGSCVVVDIGVSLLISREKHVCTKFEYSALFCFWTTTHFVIGNVKWPCKFNLWGFKIVAVSVGNISIKFKFRLFWIFCLHLTRSGDLDLWPLTWGL